MASQHRIRFNEAMSKSSQSLYFDSENDVTLLHPEHIIMNEFIRRLGESIESALCISINVIYVGWPEPCVQCAVRHSVCMI